MQNNSKKSPSSFSGLPLAALSALSGLPIFAALRHLYGGENKQRRWEKEKEEEESKARDSFARSLLAAEFATRGCSITWNPIDPDEVIDLGYENRYD